MEDLIRLHVQQWLELGGPEWHEKSELEKKVKIDQLTVEVTRRMVRNALKDLGHFA